MRNYHYKAIDDNGIEVSGYIKAESISLAQSAVAQKGYIPIKVVNSSDSSQKGFNIKHFKELFSKVKPTDLILFTKQLRTMIKAGISILNLLNILEKQTENVKLKNAATTIAESIREGKSLYDAFSGFPKIFTPLYRSMLKSGELSGSLVEVLDRLIYIIEHEHKIKSDIRSALNYPIIVVLFLCAAFFILLMYVIPKFVGIFEKAGLDLPLPTIICINLYEFIKNYWYFLIIGLIAFIIMLVSYFKTENGKYVRDSFILKMPILGILFIKAAMSRFASIFAILQTSGVTVMESMKILGDVIGNAAIEKEFKKIEEQLSEGKGISGPLNNTKYFTPMVINMVAIGEESGSLDDMLQEISNHYDAEVEYAMKGLAEAIAPILTLGLTVVVGFFALAIFLPMWDLTKMVH